MSTGETPPSATARFSSPININNSNTTKKYPGGGTPKSPMLNSGTSVNRNLQAKQKLLGGKVSAPRPFNLPSLKQEQKVGTAEIPASSSPSGSHGWGSSSSSPSSSFTQPSEIHKKLGSPDQNANSITIHKSSTTEHNTATSTSSTTKAEEESKPTTTSKADPDSTSPTTAETKTTPTIRGWAVPTVTVAAIQPPSQDFPTAAEAAGKIEKPSALDDKEYLKYASSDPNHTSWDEMVSEDLDDFSVDVVEFDDGTKVQVMDENDESTSNPVLPSDRFTDDYDRSYPPKPITTSDHHYTEHHYSSYKPSYRRSEDQGYNSRYNNNVHGNGLYDNRRHSSANVGERRSSHDSRWTSRRDSIDNNNWSSNRRSSYDKKSMNTTTTPSYHPTLLQRPRRLSEQSFTSSHSHHSREDHHDIHHNPLQIIPEPTTVVDTEAAAEITAAQREVMLTAAERAKKRRDEEEAEYEAARLRARQKAEALAEKARLEKLEKEAKEAKEKPAITIQKKPAVNNSEKKSIKTNSEPAEKKESKRYSESSVATRTPQKLFEHSPLPDTSKPWNLVAAKKEVPTKSATVPPVTSTVSVSAAPPAAKTEDNEASTKDDTKPTSEAPPAPTATSTETAEEKKEEPIVEPIVDHNGKPLNEDDRAWEVFVSKVKANPTAPILTTNVTSTNDWGSFAARLEEEDDKKHGVFKTKESADIVVEEINFNQNEDWGKIPQHITQGTRGSWTRSAEDDHHAYRNRRGGRGRGGGNTFVANDRNGVGRGRGERGERIERGERMERGGRGGRRSVSNGTTSQFFHSNKNDSWRQPASSSVNDDQQQPIVTEILKKEHPSVDATTITIEKPKEVEELPAPVTQQSPTTSQPDTTSGLSKKTRLTNMLKESSSPIFPDFIEKLAGKKPANMSFMVDVDESDKDITMMDHSITTSQTQVEKVETKDEEPAAAASDTEKVLEAIDETSATTIGGITSTPPPRANLNGYHSKSKSSSPHRFTTNPNFPVLIYQYPVSQPQQSQEENLNQINVNNQRPMGVYLMPQQQYLSSNQSMVPYPPQAAATAATTSIYFPTLSWQQGKSRPEHQNRNSSSRSYHNKQQNSHNHEWESLANSNGYQAHRHNSASYRGNYRKPRGNWSFSEFRVKRGGNGNHSFGHRNKRYQQDANGDSTMTTNNHHHHQQESTPAAAVGTSL